MPTTNAFAVALRRRWWLVLLVLAGSVATSAFLTARETRLYRASTTHVVIPNAEVEGAPEVMRTLDTLERRSVIATFAKIPPAPSMRDRAAEKLAVDPRVLSAYRVTSTVVPNTNLIKIDIEGPDPVVASNYANALAAASWAEARSFYRIFSLKSLVDATPSRTPFYPDPERNYAVAAILGLLLGVFAAFVADRALAPSMA